MSQNISEEKIKMNNICRLLYDKDRLTKQEEEEKKCYIKNVIDTLCIVIESKPWEKETQKIQRRSNQKYEN